MPSGYKVYIGGSYVDLDTVFAPRVTAATADVGFKSGGVDLSDR